MKTSVCPEFTKNRKFRDKKRITIVGQAKRTSMRERRNNVFVVTYVGNRLFGEPLKNINRSVRSSEHELNFTVHSSLTWLRDVKSVRNLGSTLEEGLSKSRKSREDRTHRTSREVANFVYLRSFESVWNGLKITDNWNRAAIGWYWNRAPLRPWIQIVCMYTFCMWLQQFFF